MISRRDGKLPSFGFSEPRPPSKVQLHLRGVTIIVEKELLAAKSAKVCALLKDNPQVDLSEFLQAIPSATPEIFQLVMRFCNGSVINMSSANVVPLLCLASSLQMTEIHSPNNLLDNACSFFKRKILTSWNDCIESLKATPHDVFQEARSLGLVDACVNSIADKALNNPHLLGEPIYSEDVIVAANNEDAYKPNPRKRLFAAEWQHQDLTALPPKIYELVIQAIAAHVGIPAGYVVASLCEYLKRWVFTSSTKREDVMPVHKKHCWREVIEAVQRVLPYEKGAVPCSVLSEMLHFAVVSGASSECKNGLEGRIGRQLEQARVEDLMIPSLGNANNIGSNIECVKRILTYFYKNYDKPDKSGIMTVGDLMEELLAQLARAEDLEKHAFLQLAELTVATIQETERRYDGIYRAIDIFLAAHDSLTDSEKEEVCRVLEWDKLSYEAQKHAATNVRLPTRVVVQVLLSSQLHLRDEISREVKAPHQVTTEWHDEEEVETARLLKGGHGHGHGHGQEEVVRREMEEMGNKVMELEKECYTMRREITNRGLCHNRVGRENLSIWGEVKRKLNCKSRSDGCNCQVKKGKMKALHK